MTPDEFRGFIANAMVTAAIIFALWKLDIHFPVWAGIAIGLSMWIIAPIIPYHPKTSTKERSKP